MHTFDPSIKNSGVFMRKHIEYLIKFGVQIDEHYIGKLNSVKSVIYAVKRLRTISNNYDILHAQYGSACALISMFSTARMNVVTIRGNDWSETVCSFSIEYIHVKVSNLLTRIALYKIRNNIVVSQRLENEVRLKYPNNNIFCLPSPIDTAMFSPIEMAIARKYLKLDYKNNKFYILFTSLDINNKHKNIKFALEVVHILKRTIDVDLIVPNNVEYEQMKNYVCSSNVVICCSLNEGWPNSIKEGLACGIPYVSFDVSDLAVIAKKTNTCFISERDPQSFAKKILLSIRRSSIHDESNKLRNIVARMDMENSSIKLLKYYERLF